MMKTILEALFEGEITPAGMIIPDTPEYYQVNNEIVNLTEAWKKKLPADEYISLEEFLELINKSNMLEAAASFSYGFRLCAALMMEVLIGLGELTHKG